MAGAARPTMRPVPDHPASSDRSAHNPATGTLRSAGAHPAGHRPLAGGPGAGRPPDHRGDGLRLLRRRRRGRAPPGPRTCTPGATGSSTPGCWPGSPRWPRPPRSWASRSARRWPSRPRRSRAWPTPTARWPRPAGPPRSARSWCSPRWPPAPSRRWRRRPPARARWMQIYILRDRARTEDLVRRAAAHGYGALVLTVDAPVSGLRLRELRGGVHLPDDLSLPNLTGDSTARAHEGGFMAVVTREFEPALTPDDIGWLAALSGAPGGGQGGAAGRRRRAVRRRGRGRRRRVEPRGPPARRRPGHGRHPGRDRRRRRRAGRGLRGRRHPPRARRGQGAGAGGPGRPGRTTVAVGAGRRAGPTAWRPCCAGSKPELRRTMALCGAATVAELDRSLVRRAPGWPLDRREP